MNIQAIGENVALLLTERELETKGGIAIPETIAKPSTEGTVTSLGRDAVETGLTAGDVVGFPSHLGTRFTCGGDEFLVIAAHKLLYVRRKPLE